MKIKIGDLVRGGQIRSRAIVLQQKTGRPVQFELKEDARSSLLAWLERRGGTIDDYAFPSGVDHADHISTRQYARLVDEWVTGIGLRCEDFARIAASDEAIDHLQGHRKPACRPDLLGHTKIESTVRYLGVEVEDPLRLAEATDIYICRLLAGAMRSRFAPMCVVQSGDRLPGKRSFIQPGICKARILGGLLLDEPAPLVGTSSQTRRSERVPTH